MKARFSYLLLFLLPIVMVAIIVTVFAGGASAGILWLYVYGDNVWPQSANNVFMAVIVVVFSATLITLCLASYAFGKKRESCGGLKGSHVALAVGASILMPGLGLLHQLSVGNIGPQTDNVICSHFCLTKDFRGSRIPSDGTCRCLGTDGSAALNVSIESIRAKK
ncbi:hypothetical protein ACW7G0_07750 [Lysobacter sp. A286]